MNNQTYVWDYLSILMVMRIISGIYRIVNTKNRKFYIGSSKNIIRRFGIHRSGLNHNRHHCIHLQRSWNKHGQAAFKFEILKEISNASEQQLLDEELKFINELLPAYNVGGVGGGDNLTKNPNREDIIKRITESLRARIAEMTEVERKRIWSHPGKTNFNWKGGLTFCECGNRISSNALTCAECRDRTGILNPFYGKTHSLKTRNHLRKINKGKLPPNLRSVKVDGVTYPSVTSAARELKVCNATVLFRIKSKYWDYEYVTPQPEIQSSDAICNLSA
jgi:group I intron endonuclease